MKEYQEKVCSEKDALVKKIFNLEEFIFTNQFLILSQEQRADLLQQLVTMEDYKRILSKRVASF